MLLKENIAEERTLSDYEIERNKPMPNRIHGTIQTKLSVLLSNEWGSEFDFPNEVTLASTPVSTPDICVFPIRELDWETTEAKETEVPLTTIEIISPSQSIDEMARKVWQVYFPLGIKSAWLVIPPPIKSVCIVTPDNKTKFFEEGMLHDPATGIEIDVEKIFAGLK